MEKNNSKIIIAILTVLVLCLAGFIVYDKTLNSGNKTTVNTGNDQKNDDNSKTNTDNCPKCEKCENSSSNTNSYGEKITSFKKITNGNETVKIGTKEVKIRKEDNALYINDKKFNCLNAYLTDKFILITGFGQYAELIDMAYTENGEVSVNSNNFNLDNFKLVDGYLHATGHWLVGFDAWTSHDVVIRYILDPSGNPEIVVIPAC